MIVPGITEGDILDSIAREYYRTQLHDGDVTIKALMARLHMGHIAARAFMEDTARDNPGIELLQVVGKGGKEMMVLRGK